MVFMYVHAPGFVGIFSNNELLGEKKTSDLEATHSAAADTMNTLNATLRQAVNLRSCIT